MSAAASHHQRLVLLTATAVARAEDFIAGRSDAACARAAAADLEEQRAALPADDAVETLQALLRLLIDLLRIAARLTGSERDAVLDLLARVCGTVRRVFGELRDRGVFAGPEAGR